MAERLADRPDADLERALRDLGEAFPAPSEPDLAGAVGARLRAEPAVAPVRVLRPGRTLRRAALLAAALLLLAAGVAVAGKLGFPGVRIIFSKTPPTVAPTTRGPASSPPADPGKALGLGDPATLRAARAAVPFPVRVPTLASLGDPDDVYVAYDVPGGRVSLTYAPRPGWPESDDTGVALLLTQLRGSTERNLFIKIIGPGTSVDDVRVHGYPGMWIHGAPHEIYFRGPDGGVESDTVRLSGNVLLWQEGGVILRLEGAPTLEQALAVANSTRTAGNAP